MNVPSPQTKAYSYLRFSTPEQMRGDSFRRQTAMAEAYALQHGLDLDTSLTFHDLGVSAYRGRNLSEEGQLGAFLLAVQNGLVQQGSFLLVESLDRISRQTARVALRSLEAVVDAGAVVVTLNDGRRYDKENLDADPTALLLSILTFMRAHEESAIKASRLKAVWAEKRKQAVSESHPMTSSAPAWLRLDPVAGRFVEIEERVSVVRRIFEMTLAGIGQQTIAKVFNEEGVVPFGRGKFWHRTYIAKILKNPAVNGIFIPHVQSHAGGKIVRTPLEPIPGYFPAIVQAESVERVASMLDGSVNPRRGRHAAMPLGNLLGGVAKCAICGSTMTVTNKGGGNRYFVCTRAKVGAGCRYMAIPYGEVEECLLSNWPALLSKVPETSEEERRIRSSLIELNAHLDWIDSAVGSIVSSIESSGSSAPPESLITRLNELELDRARTKKARDGYLAREASIDQSSVSRRVQTLQNVLSESELNRTKANAALRQVFRAVRLEKESGRLEFHWKHSEYCSVVQMKIGGGASVAVFSRSLSSPQMPPLPSVPDVPQFRRGDSQNSKR